MGLGNLHPAAIFILGALLIPLLRGRVKSAYMIALPVLGFINLLQMAPDFRLAVGFLDFELLLIKADRMSLVFGYIFHIISFIAAIYVLHVKNDVEYLAGFLYAGAALGVVFAGDLFTFFVFWEMLTIGSVLLIWQGRTRAAQAAGFRYLLVHVFGGLVLLAGVVMYVMEQGTLAFGQIGLSSLATWLIFIAIGINCAWPLLHAWLPDAYPEASIGGTVFLSAFTTKTAVYVLARTFPGTELLIWIGAVMVAFPIFYAVIENDLRRVLSYSLINQVGFMVVGVGIGTELAINGTAAHAFAHILYKALLFMSVGAVMYRTGTANATGLGGLYKSMPLTALFCIIGAASISAFPLFSGFVSKSMVMDAAAKGHLTIVWLVLLFASAGVFHHSGIKIPFFTFYGHDAGHRVKEAPPNMLIAMGIAAFLCVFIGAYPAPLYAILPYPVDYVPYTTSHVVAQLQLLFYSALAFTLLLMSGIYPAEMRSVNLDADLLYRKGGNLFYRLMDRVLNGLNTAADRLFIKGFIASLCRIGNEATGRVMLLLAKPLWAMQGESREERQALAAELRQKIDIGALSTSLIAIGGAIYLALLFFL